ncbi:MAG: sodium ion-translocating decarboxylase subunit beta [Clostridiales bacterium]|nr:sodium ion-translocating decarboxylase subunit beta [Clostridiales bacterium]
MEFITKSLMGLWETSGVFFFLQDPLALVMVGIACVLLYLAIVKGFEPLLLLPIAFGMLLTNLLGSEVFHEELFAGGHVNWGLFGGAAMLDGNALQNAANYWVSANGNIFTLAGNQLLGHFVNAVSFADGQTQMYLTDALAQLAANGNAASIVLESTYYLDGAAVLDSMGRVIAETGGKYVSGGLLDYLYLGVKLGIYPCLIFMGVGAGTDFGPLISNPKTLLLGAAAQLGIFATFIFANAILPMIGNAIGVPMGFDAKEASSIGIIGGADGPTAIWLTGKLAPHLLGPIAVAAYSYMALVPVIQPPIMRLLTTKKERQIVMTELKPATKTQKILFPIVVTILVSLLLPSAASLVGCLMLGNLVKECGVTERLNKTMQNELMNIVTIFLGITVGATATASTFLKLDTILIIAMGIVAFSMGTAGGVLLAKVMNWLSGGTINPLIGSAGVSAVPMAARVSQREGQKANPANFLLMHAMGPNVAGVIGSAIAAGVLLSMFGG